MADYREQAIKDFSVWSGFPSPTVLALLDVNPTVRYAVAQREARLRLEEALRDLMFASQGLVSEAYLRDAAAALDAVKDPGTSELR